MSGGLAPRMKGKRGEREAAKLIEEITGHKCQRGLQSRGGGKEQADVMGLPGFHIEVKRTKRGTRLNAWVKQAESDCPDTDVPVVLHREDGRPWYATLWAEDFLRLLKELESYREEREANLA